VGDDIIVVYCEKMDLKCSTSHLCLFNRVVCVHDNRSIVYKNSRLYVSRPFHQQPLYSSKYILCTRTHTYSTWHFMPHIDADRPGRGGGKNKFRIGDS
jgi:hypothetical protein